MKKLHFLKKKGEDLNNIPLPAHLCSLGTEGELNKNVKAVSPCHTVQSSLLCCVFVRGTRRRRVCTTGACPCFCTSASTCVFKPRYLLFRAPHIHTFSLCSWLTLFSLRGGAERFLGFSSGGRGRTESFLRSKLEPIYATKCTDVVYEYFIYMCVEG